MPKKENLRGIRILLEWLDAGILNEETLSEYLDWYAVAGTDRTERLELYALDS